MSEKTMSQLMKEDRLRKAEEYLKAHPDENGVFNFTMNKWRNFNAGEDGRPVVGKGGEILN